MPILFLFQEKFIEKYFKKFHLPKIQFQLLDEQLMDLLPYLKGRVVWIMERWICFINFGNNIQVGMEELHKLVHLSDTTLALGITKLMFFIISWSKGSNKDQ